MPKIIRKCLRPNGLAETCQPVPLKMASNWQTICQVFFVSAWKSMGYISWQTPASKLTLRASMLPSGWYYGVYVKKLGLPNFVR